MKRMMLGRFVWMVALSLLAVELRRRLLQLEGQLS